MGPLRDSPGTPLPLGLPFDGRGWPCGRGTVPEIMTPTLLQARPGGNAHPGFLLAAGQGKRLLIGKESLRRHAADEETTHSSSDARGITPARHLGPAIVCARASTRHQTTVVSSTGRTLARGTRHAPYGSPLVRSRVCVLQPHRPGRRVSLCDGAGGGYSLCRVANQWSQPARREAKKDVDWPRAGSQTVTPGRRTYSAPLSGGGVLEGAYTGVLGGAGAW